MKVIMVMYDSLNRHFLPNYGDTQTIAPNFSRLGQKALTFDNFYAGSLPCMPARREIHTGRHNFLHRSWSPLEPFDDSLASILKSHGIYTHLVSDHCHYWEDGGATYHTRYNSWEIARGQEGDPWKGLVSGVDVPETTFTKNHKPILQLKAKALGIDLQRQDAVNRLYLQNEESLPQTITFDMGLEFINTNKDADNWFLQLETFDPHEPFYVLQKYLDLYTRNVNPGDWPPYGPVLENPEEVEAVQNMFRAVLSMCDRNLGRVLDALDQHQLWDDTMLIVNTDHGYMLGEHGWWSKSVMPTYNEIAHIPFFLWDPRFQKRGKRCGQLAQTTDIAPTILEFFSIDKTKDMQGVSLRPIVENDMGLKDHAIFGYHGGHVNITDGRYIYMRGPARRDNQPLFDYTLMPTHMKSFFSPRELKDMELSGPFSFTKDCKVLKIKVGRSFMNPAQYGSKLFDLEADPGQEAEIEDLDVEHKLCLAIIAKMKESDAPPEQYERLGFPVDRAYSKEDLVAQKIRWRESEKISGLEGIHLDPGVHNQMMSLLNTTPESERAGLLARLHEMLRSQASDTLSQSMVKYFVQNLPIPEEQRRMSLYFMELAGRTK
ncbi:MAG: sulfatase [Spirochaetota bacterium]